MTYSVLHISTTKNGGAGIAAFRLHKAMLKEGVNSTFLSLDKEESIENKLVYFKNFTEEIKTPNITPSLTLKNYLKEKLFNEFSKKKKDLNLEKKDKNEPNLVVDFEAFSSPYSKYDITLSEEYHKADIIHLHWVAGFIDYSTFFKKNEKPIIWTLHDENPFKGGLHYSIEEQKLSAELKEIDKEYEKIKKEALDLQNELTIITPSVWLRGKAKNSSLLKNRKIEHIYYTIDESIFKPLDQKVCRDLWGLPEDKTIFLFVAGHLINNRKGFNLLQPIFYDSEFENCQFLIVGENNSITKYENVMFTGKITDERLLTTLYNSSDFFVLPSREDNLPNTMLESFSCGTPVIAFDISDMKILLEKEKMGIVCDKISTESIKSTLLLAINSKKSFNKTEISNKALNLFNSKNIVSKYKVIYNSILKNNG